MLMWQCHGEARGAWRVCHTTSPVVILAFRFNVKYRAFFILNPRERCCSSRFQQEIVTMVELSSLQKLCEHLISSAIRRCRVSDDLCRISVVLKSSSSNPPTARIAISDTGTGSRLDEFQGLKLTQECVTPDTWDGMISLTTTNICDNEVFQYHLNLRETDSCRRLIKLPSYSKNGAKFSGTEVSLSALKTVNEFLERVTPFFQKMQILKIPKVAIELVVEHGEKPGSLSPQFILAEDCFSSVPSSSNVELLKSGFEGYVYKHGNRLNEKCPSCFPGWEHLKVGSGMASSSGCQRSTTLGIEAVIIINESCDPCLVASGAKSEVLYFKDYSLCSISQSALKAFAAIDWKTYGLALNDIVEQGDHAVLEWVALPAHTHINIVLHCYHKQPPPARQKTRAERCLVKKAVKCALDDLKKRYTGALLSVRALKVRSYAPDLAKTIAGLILSSNNPNFQGECISLLGLQPQEIGGETVECCIRDKIVSVIEKNDQSPRRRRETAQFLFEDGYCEEPDCQEEEYEGDEYFSPLDL